jgi:hypothetical protein
MVVIVHSHFSDYLEQVMKYMGIVMLIFGLLGLIMLVFTAGRFEKIYQIGLGFIYMYLMFLGFLIAIYHDKIIVRGYRT